MQYNDTLQTLTGRITRMRPGLDITLARDLINDRVRQIIDRRVYWAGLWKRGVLNLPPAYATGGVSLTIGSNICTGTGTSWPVSDVVNTTISQGVVRPGNAWVTPASMSGITLNSTLYVDDAGTPEIVAVQQIRGNQFLANFQNPHNPGYTVTQSSLVGQQLFIATNNPYFTILGVTSATSMVLDNEWAYTNLSQSAYQIFMAYTTFAPDVKELAFVVDPIQQLVLRLHVPQNMVNSQDPSRQNFNSPVWICDLGPNAAGNQLFEIYPPSTVAYQLYYGYYAQWPEMVAPGDRPPPFINPTVLIHGALADAYRVKIPRPPKFDDPWFNPKAADDYEKKFEMGVADMINADNSKAQTDLTWDFDAFGISGANYNIDHAVDAYGNPMF